MTQRANAGQESIQFLPMTGKAVIVKKSPFSGVFHTMTLALTEPQYSDWLGGALIQNALPHLSADEREFLMTGITPEEWETYLGKE